MILSMDRLKSVPSRLWRRRSNQAVSSPEEEYSSVIMLSPEEEPDPSQLAIDENDRLQNTVADLTFQLQTVQNSHLALQSRADDLDQKLQLEQRRIDWQKRFYERKIVDVAMGVVSDRGSINPEQILASLSQEFYQETILELVAEQERKEGELQNIRNSFQEEIKALQKRQETDLAETMEQHFFHIQQLTQTQEELIRDLVGGCEQGLFKEMKEEYLVESERNVELQATNGNKVWIQFQKFPSQKKGIIIAIICIVTVATAGFAGWGFITWMWPRLIIFAESVLSNPTTLSAWMTYLVEILNSPQFQTFVLGWEQGQPLASCLKPFMNTALLASALQMAPNLFSQLKKRKSNN